MNLIDAKVTRVLSEPMEEEFEDMETGKYAKWWEVTVTYVDIGGEGKKELLFDTKEDAEKVKEGYIFQH